MTEDGFKLEVPKEELHALLMRRHKYCVGRANDLEGATADLDRALKAGARVPTPSYSNTMYEDPRDAMKRHERSIVSYRAKAGEAKFFADHLPDSKVFLLTAAQLRELGVLRLACGEEDED